MCDCRTFGKVRRRLQVVEDSKRLSTADTIPPVSPPWNTAGSSADEPRASCGILEAKLSEAPLRGTIDWHTRWATHGKPNETNAHPHERPEPPASRWFTTASSRIFGSSRASSREAPGPVRDGNGYRGRCAARHLRNASAAPLCRRGCRRDVALRLRRRIRARLPLRRRGGPADRRLGMGPRSRSATARRDVSRPDALALAPFTDEVGHLDEGDWVVSTRAGARRS